MQIQVKLSALPTRDGKFLPHFILFEFEGPQLNTNPYHFRADAIRDTREEALSLAKAHALRKVHEEYGDIKVSLKE